MHEAVVNILLCFAIVFEFIACFWNPQPAPRWNLVAAGLLCFFLSLLLGGLIR
jgi:hypothetical protein